MTPQEQAMRESIKALVKALEGAINRFPNPKVWRTFDSVSVMLRRGDMQAMVDALADARKLLEELSHER